MNYSANHEFRAVGIVHYGPGALQKLSAIIREIAGKKPFIVTGKRVGKLEDVKKATESLRHDAFSVTIFDELVKEPTMDEVERGVELFDESGCDCIIGIGGGSRIDAAKAISMMVTNPGSIADYEGWGKFTNPGVPLITINTTAGTGSEVTQGTVITDTSRNVKMIIASPLMLPRAAIDDPLLTISMPPTVTSFTGMDALTHAIEGYIARKAQPLSDILALQAMTLISKRLQVAYAVPEDLGARGDMMFASLLGGMIINQTSTALIHAMARPLGTHFDIPHGLCNAILLPYVLKYSALGNPEKSENMLRAMGYQEAISSIMIGKKLVEICLNLCRNIGIPSLNQMGIEKEKYLNITQQMAEDAIKSGSPANNPRRASIQQIIEIYERAFEEELDEIV